ncbi:MAG: hypothetical protein R3Y07_01830 [Eubacteriales bacterium]
MMDNHTPVSQKIATYLAEVADPYHLDVEGVAVELRYQSEAPTLQEKVIALCQNKLEL